jgi:hypothetical protein
LAIRAGRIEESAAVEVIAASCHGTDNSGVRAAGAQACEPRPRTWDKPCWQPRRVSCRVRLVPTLAETPYYRGSATLEGRREARPNRDRTTTGTMTEVFVI